MDIYLISFYILQAVLSEAESVISVFSFLPCSGADYYDYGHGLSEDTYDSYGEWFYELNHCSSRLWKKKCNERIISMRQALVLQQVMTAQGFLRCHRATRVIIEKNALCGLLANPVMGN